jgi:hypothetical protein
MSSAFDNGIPNLQSSDATRNSARKTIFNNLRKENEHANPSLVGKYQPIRVCSTDGCVVSTPSYQSKMDVNFGWLLCETPWCNYNMTNPANGSGAGKYLELNTSDVTQPVVDTRATSGTFAGDIYSIYDTDPDSSEIVMDLGGSTMYGVYEPGDMHIDPDGKLFSGQQIRTSGSTDQNVTYCSTNSTSWKNYIAPQSRYTTAASSNPYQLFASQNTSRVPTNVTYGTKYSIFRTNGTKNENNPVQPCLCQEDGGDTTGPAMAISSSTVSHGFATSDTVIALTFTSSKVTTDFEADDITATNGVISDFAGSGTGYTATFTTTAVVDAECSVVVPGGTFTGPLGNINTVSNTFEWTYEVSGTTLVLYMDDSSGGAPVAVPPPPDPGGIGTSIPIGVHYWGPGGEPAPPNVGKVLYIGTFTNTGGVYTAVFESGYREAEPPVAGLPQDWSEPGLFNISEDGSGDVTVSLDPFYFGLTYGSPEPYLSGPPPPLPANTAVLLVTIDAPFPYPFLSYPFPMWFVDPDGTVTQAPDL